MFVTAFLNLNEDRSDRSPKTRFEMFRHLAELNLPMILFCSREHVPYIPAMTNLRIIPMELEELETYWSAPTELPATRNVAHDTRQFLILMNAKAEFMRRAMELAPYEDQYAWIDFSVFHIVKNVEETKRRLMLVSQTRFRGFQVPGCWPNGTYSIDHVCWRFCGGFFIGDRASMLEFVERHDKTFSSLKKLTWEVNVWAMMEAEGWRPGWYAADHNDSMFRVPMNRAKVVACITTIPPRFQSCRRAIASLLPQVDTLYVCIPTAYKRFAMKEFDLPGVVVRTEDYGPATKYLGALDEIAPKTWIFVGDDDQVYSPTLVGRMLDAVTELAVYQNRASHIAADTSGGLVHGFVGNLINRGMLNDLRSFPRPECAFFVDDQWMSIYFHKKGIKVRGTGIEAYGDIFAELENGVEKKGEAALAELGNRADCVAETAKYFKVKFEGPNIKEYYSPAK